MPNVNGGVGLIRQEKSFVTIVMYHYVRHLETSSYPNLKALRLSQFREQLEYIGRYYTVVTMEEVILASKGQMRLPTNALLLTFDDGYRDHFENVFPLLKSKGYQGSFFAPAKAIVEREILDVNKLHFILASTVNPSSLIEVLYEELDRGRREYGLLSNQEYWHTYGKPGKYDTAEVMFVKRMLQSALPEKLRSAVVDSLFSTLVTPDAQKFAEELYMSEDELKHLHNEGMYIGSHGYSHQRFSFLSPDEQEFEVSASLEFLKNLGCNHNDWVMCYPYGSYDESIVSILSRKSCALGLTTNVGIADLTNENHLLLSRLDTNDLPKVSSAEANSWTKVVQS